MAVAEMNSPMATILVVDDVAANRNVLAETLENAGFEVLLAADGESAVKIADKARPDVILLDVLMPGLNGFETCQRLKASDGTAAIPVIFISAQNDTSSTVQGFKSGGVDYITKPFQTEEVLVRVRTHLLNHQLTREVVEKNCALESTNAQLRSEIARREQAESSLEIADATLSLISDLEAERWGLPAFVGRSQAMRDVIDGIRKLQATDNIAVLIRGESGTGKELVARALHFSGCRSRQPFIAVNCAAIPNELAESLFFGYVRGSFTGAAENRKGYFEIADRGTLFLDEIADMTPHLQAKLLRVLQDGAFTPIGASVEKRANVRIIAATNVDLKARIESGAFRNDLYFRIAGYEIELKPLRDRRDDIELLSAHFIQTFAAEQKRPIPTIDATAIQALCEYDYPGNIRELKSILERACIQSAGQTILPSHLHLATENVRRNHPGIPGLDAGQIPLNLEEAELELVRRALAKAEGNVSHAARYLGINRTKIYRILSRDEATNFQP